MRIPGMITVSVTTLGMVLPGFAASPPTPAPAIQELGQATWMIAGSLRPDYEPDGNTVVFDAPEGLIVVDTGRHEWHRQAILTLAEEKNRSIFAVINTHWHLDHVSGNPALRAAFPRLRVYASNAIDGALTGFLATSAREYADYVDDERLAESLRADIRRDIESIRNGAALRPDEFIAASTSMNLGGRRIQVNLARHAVTSGDLWLYDERSGVAVLGDLVTLPVPFLDTACPDGWRAALAQISNTRFRVAVPGHGPPITPADVSTYRRAFESFIDCADSPGPSQVCAAGWVEAVKSLLDSDTKAVERARSMANDYVAMLRANGGRSKHCEAAAGAKSSR